VCLEIEGFFREWTLVVAEAQLSGRGLGKCL